jgi:hypothetical protein
MNLTVEGQILLEVRRLYGAGRSLFISCNEVLEEFKNVASRPEPDLCALSKIAMRDAGLVSRLTEVANATLRFKSSKKPISSFQAVNRLGVNGCKSVVMTYIFEQSNLSMATNWKKEVAALNKSLLQITENCYTIATEAERPDLAREAFEISILFTLTCYAKIIACNNLKIKTTRQVVEYARRPEPELAEMLALAIGLPVDELSQLNDGHENDSISGLGIAKQAWSQHDRNTLQSNVLTYQFKH